MFLSVPSSSSSSRSRSPSRSRSSINLVQEDSDQTPLLDWIGKDFSFASICKPSSTLQVANPPDAAANEYMSLVKAIRKEGCVSNDSPSSSSPVQENPPQAALVGKFSFLIGDTALADTRLVLVVVSSNSCNEPLQVCVWQYR